MKVEEVQELLTNNGVEINENINVDEISKGINTFATGLKESSVEKALKGVDGSQYVNQFLTDNDFENVDQFNSFVKNGKATTSELQEKSTRLESEAEGYIKQISELQETIFNRDLSLAFSKVGVTDMEIIKDFTPIIKNNLGEDGNVEEVVKSVVERYNIGKETPRIGNPKGGNPSGKEMTMAEKIQHNLNQSRK